MAQFLVTIPDSFFYNDSAEEQTDELLEALEVEFGVLNDEITVKKV